MTSTINPRHHHVSISVADLDRQTIWYQQVLGFEKIIEKYEVPEPPVRTAVLQTRTGTRVELIERTGSTRPRVFTDPLDACREQGYGHWALDVDDLDAAYTVLTAAGAQSVWPPADAVQPGARFAYVKDPEGNLIELIQPPAAT